MRASGQSKLPARVRLQRYLLLWPGRARRLSPVAVLAGVGALLLIAVLLFSVVSWIVPVEGGLLSADTSCDGNGFSCGALTELIATALTLAIAAASFVYWRVFRIAHKYLEGGLEDPASLVPTASPMGEVVGRDALCGIIEEDLRQDERRPQLIVGGVGEGKTAVLVKLTELLIERCAVPVAIRLRDADGSLDFLELAKTRFMARVQRTLLSDDEGDKVWRKLCNDHRVVILADGLDEALHGRDDREPEIRRAVKKAAEEKLPLVLTSRPGDELRTLEAAVIRLEPLSEADALVYIDPKEETRERLDELIAAAEVTESPLYLQLASKLACHEALPEVPSNGGRLATRVALLERWRECLLDGADKAAEHPKAYREAAFRGLESMACVALGNNTLELRLETFRETPTPDGVRVERRDPGIAASVGPDLLLVERVPGGVRFRHSVMQAYLGGLAIPAYVRDPLRERFKRRTMPSRARQSFLDRAMEDPSRELLMAFAVASHQTKGTGVPLRLERRLRAAALEAEGPVAFDLLAAAYEVDHFTSRDATAQLGRSAAALWKRKPGQLDPVGDPRLSEAKIRAVARMEESGGTPTYGALWEICKAEDTYRVRLRAAQALAEGGPRAHDVLRPAIEEALARGRRLRGAPARDPAPGEVRLCSLMGWILPSLASKCGAEHPRDADPIVAALRVWINLSRGRLHLGVEGCLAQGFKYAANRLPHRTSPETTAELVQLAEQLLDCSNWWYSQLSLVQALTLWALKADPKKRSEIRALVADWTGDDRHPLVREAAMLCESAIAEADEGGAVEPSNYLWIDEAGVVQKIGAGTVLPDPVLAHRRTTAGLWVSPAAGWKTLKPDARRLVGDVLVYLNLIEGGEPPAPEGSARGAWTAKLAREREERRQTVSEQGVGLPPCMTEPGGHDLMRPVESENGAAGSRETAKCDCAFGLCPYPKPDHLPFRGETRETFCREQMRLARTEDAPPWYEAGRRLTRPRGGKDDLSKFWKAMEKRAQQTSSLLLSAND